MNFKALILAARLRTLPLSVAGIITGGALAMREERFSVIIFLLAILTTVLFQVLSNFANDYGDGVKGTDGEDRVGPKRALQSGMLSRRDLKWVIIITAFLSLVSATVLVFLAFGLENWVLITLFLFLGIASVVAAVTYTVGDRAYGYQGLGDIFVFLFFGILAVVGSYFLFTQQFKWVTVLPAIAVGALSTGVLNLNNMRDHEGDARSGKNTLVVQIGYTKAVWYHGVLISTALVATGLYVYLTGYHPGYLLLLLLVLPLLKHLQTVRSVSTPTDLDPQLKVLALSTFGYSVLFFIVLRFFL